MEREAFRAKRRARSGRVRVEVVANGCNGAALQLVRMTTGSKVNGLTARTRYGAVVGGNRPTTPLTAANSAYSALTARTEYVAVVGDCRRCRPL